MRVLQTTFGVFHHFELARELHRRGFLQRVMSTWPWRRLEREGIPRELVASYPWVHTPEMLLRRFGLAGPWLLDQTGYANALTFDRFVTRRLQTGVEPQPDALIALSGSSLVAGRLIQERGGLFVCDRGSSHQRYQNRLVTEEYKRWGITTKADERDTLREEEIYAQADAITIPSSFAARSFVEQGVSVEKLHVIPYGVRLEQFRKMGEPPIDRMQFLFAGSVGLRKGFPYLLEAFARFSHPRKVLRVAGAIQTEMRRVMEKLPRENVEFLGPIPQSRLIELMSESHAMVLPSVEEGLALVQGQALACGCPVIATTNTGAEDLFQDGVEGFIVPIRDADALLRAMQRLADEPELRPVMSAAALQRVHQLGGWSDYGDRWELLLRQLVAKSPRQQSELSPAGLR